MSSRVSVPLLRKCCTSDNRLTSSAAKAVCVPSPAKDTRCIRWSCSPDSSLTPLDSAKAT
ncbi:MAG: hypothetical protein JW847_05660 [Candidatus Omnitrophica bacterium]|nr:hypothetical protein [Candidatus Omnitrophota bacterium]